MNAFLIVFLGALAVLLILIGRPLLQARRRRRLRSRPLPPEWRELIERSTPLYRRLPPDLRRRLDGLIQQFIAEKEFVGCRGLEVTLQMKLIVAAQACLLVLNRPDRACQLYNQLYSVLLYPTAFIVPEEQQDDAGVVTMHESILSGQAWETHRIILSWDDIQSGLAQPAGGYHVVLHEFAHYLDAEDGELNGAPDLRHPQRYERWAQVMSAEYQKLCAAAERGEETLLDPYGAEDPAEFFAVATESFFGQPGRLRREHPDLYRELTDYYRLDPAHW